MMTSPPDSLTAEGAAAIRDGIGGVVVAIPAQLQRGDFVLTLDKWINLRCAVILSTSRSR